MGNSQGVDPNLVCLSSQRQFNQSGRALFHKTEEEQILNIHGHIQYVCVCVHVYIDIKLLFPALYIENEAGKHLTV